MKFLFGGCSHTWGDELNPITREKERYSHIVCQHFGVEEVNTAKPAASIPNVIYNLYPKIIESHFDLCVVQLPPSTRIALPIFDKVDHLALRKSSLDNEEKEKHKALKIYLAKMILSSNTKDSRENFWDVHGFHLNMFEDSCKLRNIKTIYFHADFKYDTIDHIKDRCPDIDLLDVGLLDYVREQNLPLAEHGHLQAESHKAFARNILIPEIEKRL